jgi:NSS family neurotransmitter:Na+ symporter
MKITPREHWKSGLGFVLAALGSAVGLGNVWRFSYVTGENGGGTFLLIYVGMVLVVGMPLLIAEFAAGRSTQRENVSALQRLAPTSPWRNLGLLGVFIATLVLAYYAVIAGWVFKYLSIYLLQSAHTLAEPDFSSSFSRHVAAPLEPLMWQGAGLIACTAILAKGVQRGIERASLLLMPLLAVLLLALAARSASLPGFDQALAFLFTPDWAALTRPGVYLAALGQALFSIGLAMGVMVTYGSYLGPERSLPKAATVVVLGDTLFALTAGLVIFPAVFSFGLDPAEGPGLAFVVLPQVFDRMSGGTTFGAVFFGLLSIAALTSMVSLLEVPVAYATERFGLSRRKATLGLVAGVFLVGAPASLGFGLWSEVRLFADLSLLDLMDALAVDLLLPLHALMLSLMLGWAWPKPEAIKSSGLSEGVPGLIWHTCLRYLTPLLCAVILVTAVARLH